MDFARSLRKRLVASEPCCLVCGKRLRLSQAQQVPVLGRLNVLACAKHAPMLAASLEGLGRVGKWLGGKLVARLGGPHVEG